MRILGSSLTLLLLVLMVFRVQAQPDQPQAAPPTDITAAQIALFAAASILVQALSKNIIRAANAFAEWLPNFLKTVIENREARIQRLTMENRELESRINRISELETRVDSLYRQIAQVNAQQQEQERRHNEEVESLNQKVNTMSVDLTTKNALLDTAAKEIQSLQEKVREEQERAESEKRRADEEERKRREAEAEAERLRAELTKLRERLKETENTAESEADRSVQADTPAPPNEDASASKSEQE